MGPFPRSHLGHNFLIVSTCLFSKYVWLRPVRAASAQNIVKHLEEDIFLKFAVPGTILCDNAKQYSGVEMQSLCSKYGVKLKHSFFYHAQANPTERANRVIKTMIACYVRGNHKTWDKKLHYIQMAINSVKHDVTGYSPHELIFGEKWKGHGSYNFVGMDGQEVPEFGERHVNQKKFLDIQEDVVKRLHQAYQRNAKYYNLRRRPVTFSIGQVVYRRNHVQSDKAKGITKKLAPKFIGPYRVLKAVGHRGYLLEDSAGVKDGPWHVEDLKPGPEGDERFRNDDGDGDQLKNGDVVASVECPQQIKLCTWNVAGFRAFVKKGGWNDILKENFDVVCLQEVKCNLAAWSKLSLPGGFYPYWFAGENPGYCGVAILSKLKPLQSAFGFGDAEFDSEARLVTVWFESFILVNIYAPYSGEYLHNLQKRIAWEDRLFLFLQTLGTEGLPVIVCGDFNVAADIDRDVDPREIYPYVAGATVTERTAFRRTLSLGFCDVFRQHYPSVNNAFSFWRYGSNNRVRNQGWRLDYFLISTSLSECVKDVEIRTDLRGSDHCPVTMQLLLE
jgi:exodeoxyribonuclease III